jgi:hypothetical protein
MYAQRLNQQRSALHGISDDISFSAPIFFCSANRPSVMHATSNKSLTNRPSWRLAISRAASCRD